MPVFQRRIHSKSKNQPGRLENASHGVAEVVEGTGVVMQRAKSEAEGCIADYFERTNSIGRPEESRRPIVDLKKNAYRKPIGFAAIGVGLGFLISSLLHKR
jgi:hypothetical protein